MVQEHFLSKTQFSNCSRLFKEGKWWREAIAMTQTIHSLLGSWEILSRLKHLFLAVTCITDNLSNSLPFSDQLLQQSWDISKEQRFLKQPSERTWLKGCLTPEKLYLDDGVNCTVCPFSPHCLPNSSHQHFCNDHWSQWMSLAKQTLCHPIRAQNPNSTTGLGLLIAWQVPRKWSADRKAVWFRAKYNCHENNAEAVLWNLVSHI